MRLLIFSMALLLAASSGSLSARDTPSEPTAAERLANARSAIKTQDWSVSIFELSAVVREEPGNADAHNLLAYAYRRQPTPNLAKAFEHYQIALKLDPRHKGAHEYIGEAYLMARNLAKAEEHLARLQAICGNTSCEEYAELAESIADYKAKSRQRHSGSGQAEQWPTASTGKWNTP